MFVMYQSKLKENCIEGPLISDFRVGIESLCTPFALLLFDIVLTGNEGSTFSCFKNRALLFKCLAINSIRQKMTNCQIITPLHKVVSNDVSLSCSKSLMTLLNMAGLTFSYSKDLKDGKISRKLWNTIGIRSAVQDCKSNMHWIECDNLETMLKSTTIHNAERLTHFMTSQLEYNPESFVVLDLYKKPPVHMLDPKVFHVNEEENVMHSKFLDSCLGKCVELHEHFNCDNVVSALPQGQSQDHRTVQFPSIDKSTVPSERILNLGEVRPKPKTVYLRMEKLCSSNIFDVKKLLDLTANDYGLNEPSYLPCVAISPLIFASETLNECLISANFDEDTQPPPPYTLTWGFVEETGETPEINGCLTTSRLQSMLNNAVEKLKDKPHSLFSVSRLLEVILYQSQVKLSVIDKIMLSIFYAELLRKQGHLSHSCYLLRTAYKELNDCEIFSSSLFAK